MQDLESIVAIAAGLVTLLGVVAAITRQLTKVQEQAAARDQREALIVANQGFEARVQELERQRSQLREQVELAARAGSAALHQKVELDAQLQAIMTKTGTSAGSIYLPVRSPRGEIQGLAFLCIEPFSAQTQALRARVIPLKSLAGVCFTTGRSTVVSNASQSPDHFKAAEKISGYRPSTTMTLALRHDDEVVGVLQLLRREGEEGFGGADLDVVSAMLGSMPAQVAAVSRAPDYLRLLGLAAEGSAGSGTILCFDLSQSSLLFKEVPSAAALHMLNEYFEAVCEQAFRHGGTLDNYMGDGALLRFNVPRPCPDHQLAAVRAALEMNRVFAELKEYWVTLSPFLQEVHHRTGVASGPLHPTTLGHSQAQRLTVVGPTVSVAASLCQTADRDRESVLISAETYEAIRDRVIAEALAPERLGKAGNFTSGAYEVRGLR